MGVKFSQDEEYEALERRMRNRNLDTAWEYYRTDSIVEAVHKARDMGWLYKKVQVRREVVAEDAVEYVIEPHEPGCSCRGILNYADFFDPPPHEEIVSVNK